MLPEAFQGRDTAAHVNGGDAAKVLGGKLLQLLTVNMLCCCHVPSRYARNDGGERYLCQICEAIADDSKGVGINGNNAIGPVQVEYVALRSYLSLALAAIRPLQYSQCQRAIWLKKSH